MNNCLRTLSVIVATPILLCFLAPAGAVTASGDWPTASPEAVGLDPAVLEDLVRQIRANEYSDIHSLLVIRHGTLAFEEYFTGPDERRDTRLGSKPVGTVPFDKYVLHDMRSVTKSVVSILFGIAQAQGLIGPLDDPVLKYFPQYSDLLTQDRKAITLRHVLSMTSGWEWDEDSHPYGDPANSETAMDHSDDPYRYVLERRIIATPGQRFQYCGGGTLLLGAIIERATNMPLDQYAKKVLFGPLGIANYEWIRYPNGRPIPASGLRLRSRDLAKIAQLYLQKGAWHGQQLVPDAWVRLSTSPQVPGGFYGLHWWIGTGATAVAVGYGGQRALVDPSLDLVVIVTAGLYNDRHQSDTVNRILQRCLDAVSTQ